MEEAMRDRHSIAGSHAGKHSDVAMASRRTAAVSVEVITTFVPAERLSSEANERPQSSTRGIMEQVCTT